MVPELYASVGLMLPETNEEEDGSWILEKLDLGELWQWKEEQQQAAKDLLIRSADVFSKSHLHLSRCNVLKHDIKLTDYQPFKERYMHIPPHLFEQMKNFKRYGERCYQKRFQSMGQCSGTSEEE